MMTTNEAEAHRHHDRAALILRRAAFILACPQASPTMINAEPRFDRNSRVGSRALRSLQDQRDPRLAGLSPTASEASCVKGACTSDLPPSRSAFRAGQAAIVPTVVNDLLEESRNSSCEVCALLRLIVPRDSEHPGELDGRAC